MEKAQDPTHTHTHPYTQQMHLSSILFGCIMVYMDVRKSKKQTKTCCTDQLVSELGGKQLLFLYTSASLC